jgi:putative membrane protein
MAITAGLNYALERDFAREWVDSLRVKHAAPLGEDEIARLLREREARDAANPPG